MDSTESPPVPVEGHRDEIAAEVEGADGLLVGLDFDGVLAPIATDSDAPEITPDCRAAIQDLAAAPSTAVTVVSGRELSDLTDRVGVDGVVHAGNHGLERDRDGTRVDHPPAVERQPALRDAVASLEERLDDVPGCEVEDKRLTATVHYRRTPDDHVDGVRETVEGVVSEADDDLEVTHGKAVLELRPSVDWDKGEAVREIADRLDGNRRLVYVGDDVTDEDAFRVVRGDGVGVLVGDRRDTLADYRLADQAAVAPFLSWLAGVT